MLRSCIGKGKVVRRSCNLYHFQPGESWSIRASSPNTLENCVSRYPVAYPGSCQSLVFYMLITGKVQADPIYELADLSIAAAAYCWKSVPNCAIIYREAMGWGCALG